MKLYPCDHCHRHIRAEESSCPFCATAQGLRPAERPRGVASGTSRAQRLAAVAVVLSGAACIEPVSTPVYGAPAPNENAGGSEDNSQQPDASSPAAAGADLSDGSDDAPTPVPLYGAPAPPVDSTEDEGDDFTISPLYGAAAPLPLPGDAGAPERSDAAADPADAPGPDAS